MKCLTLLLLIGALAFGQQADGEVETGIALTKQGRFAEALPHFMAAHEQGRDSFALEFNTALCYVGTRQFPKAIEILSHITEPAHTAQVNNLLAQALVGNRQPELAMQAFERGAAAAPVQETFYLLFAEACADEGYYELGVRAVSEGLRNLPDSSKLLFERGMVRSQLEQVDLAAQDFQLVRKLSAESDIGYIAATQQALLSGNIQEAVRSAREGIAKGHSHYLLLTMFGEALLRAGATPATPREFGEAKDALEKAVLARPNYAGAHIALGRLYLSEQRLEEALPQLEAGRRLDPRNRAVYPALAAAWRRAGQTAKAQEALAALAELNRQEAARIGSADGGHAGYSQTFK